MPVPNRNALADRLIESLYSEALLLADETRSYFDGQGRLEQASLAARDRVEFACEGLKATARLMQLTGWLLGRRAGSVDQLGATPVLDDAGIARLPETGRRLLTQGRDLYDRVVRLDAGAMPAAPAASPARSLLERLERSL